jgi:UDP-N-acetyl-D-galactosamine dehydrogenase
MKDQIKIAVIGLGYVGLPLARLFATKYPVVGFDINKSRVEELMMGNDSTLEVEPEILKAVLLDFNPTVSAGQRAESIAHRANQMEYGGWSTEEGTKVQTLSVESIASGLFCSTSLDDIRSCNFYIVTVPTPVDRNNRPDLTPLIKASETVGKVISKEDIVVYESTVYPGATEEDCIPVVEKISGLKFNVDFFAGYSPERINPGDKEHTVEKIKKVTSGSTPEIAERIDAVYRSVIQAGTHKAPTIKVAEAAKVIENSQRDINIAFVNELAKIFNKMGIDTNAVLEAAGTKWNFLPFKPGLVGGHCIGVDPYYLAQKAQEYGYHPEIILAGRRLNDGMGEYVANQVVKYMIRKNICVKGSDILILGFTFKENCPDIRNTKVVDIVKILKEYDVNITIYDPLANPKEVKREYGLNLTNELLLKKYDVVILSVAHDSFNDELIEKILNKKSIVYDVRGVLKKNIVIRL